MPRRSPHEVRYGRSRSRRVRHLFADHLLRGLPASIPIICGSASCTSRAVEGILGTSDPRSCLRGRLLRRGVGQPCDRRFSSPLRSGPMGPRNSCRSLPRPGGSRAGLVRVSASPACSPSSRPVPRVSGPRGYLFLTASLSHQGSPVSIATIGFFGLPLRSSVRRGGDWMVATVIIVLVVPAVATISTAAIRSRRRC